MFFDVGDLRDTPGIDGAVSGFIELVESGRTVTDSLRPILATGVEGVEVLETGAGLELVKLCDVADGVFCVIGLLEDEAVWLLVSFLAQAGLLVVFGELTLVVELLTSFLAQAGLLVVFGELTPELLS